MSKRNIRQVELKARQKDMLNLAMQYVLENKNDYDVPISVEGFLADYRIICHVGYYASLRYFKDFCENGWFQLTDNEKNFKVTSEKRVHEMIKNHYDLIFPEPKSVKKP